MFQTNLNFNLGQGRFRLIQWCILWSRESVKKSKGSSISSSSRSSKIEEAMEITFTTSSSSIHHSRSRTYQTRSLQIKVNMAVTTFNIQGSICQKEHSIKRRKAPAKSKMENSMKENKMT